MRQRFVLPRQTVPTWNGGAHTQQPQPNDGATARELS
jgi:hypothetical protein